MNRTQLIDAIASESGLTKTDSKKALDAVIKAIGGSLSQGDTVALVGFGTLSVSERPARVGRNPRTGESIKIAAKKTVKFKPGKELAELVK